jgi:hypothetical protein
MVGKENCALPCQQGAGTMVPTGLECLLKFMLGAWKAWVSQKGNRLVSREGISHSSDNLSELLQGKTWSGDSDGGTTPWPELHNSTYIPLPNISLKLHIKSPEMDLGALLSAVMKYPFVHDQKKKKKRRGGQSVSFISQSEGTVGHSGKPWRWELEVTLHLPSGSREQRMWLSTPSLPFPASQHGLPTSVNLVWKNFHRPILRLL